MSLTFSLDFAVDYFHSYALPFLFGSLFLPSSFPHSTAFSQKHFFLFFFHPLIFFNLSISVLPIKNIYLCFGDLFNYNFLLIGNSDSSQYIKNYMSQNCYNWRFSSPCLQYFTFGPFTFKNILHYISTRLCLFIL